MKSQLSFLSSERTHDDQYNTKRTLIPGIGAALILWIVYRLRVCSFFDTQNNSVTIPAIPSFFLHPFGTNNYYFIQTRDFGYIYINFLSLIFLKLWPLSTLIRATSEAMITTDEYQNFR